MNVKIKSIELTDFMSISHEKFVFDKRVNFIQGPAASGKSTVLEAISVCFSNKRRGDSYKDYVKLGKDFAKVYLDAEVNSEPIVFDLTLYRKGGTAYTLNLHYNGEVYHNTDAEPIVAKLDLDFFATLCMYMQNDAEISSLSSMERLIYIRRLVEVSFEEDTEILKKEYETLKNEITEKKNLIASIEGALSTIKTQRVPVVDEDELTAINEEADTLRKELVTAQEEIYKAFEEQKVLRDSLNALEKERSSIEKRINDIGTKTKRVESAILELADNNNKLISLRDQYDGIQRNIEAYKEEHATLTQKITELKTSSAKNKETSSSLGKKIELINAGKCPHCGQSTGYDALKRDFRLGDPEDLSNRKNLIDAEYTREQKLLTESKTRLDELNTSINKGETNGAVILSDIKRTEKLISSLETEIATTKIDTSLDELVASLAAKNEQVTSIEEKLQVAAVPHEDTAKKNRLTELDRLYADLVLEKRTAQRILEENEKAKAIKAQKQTELDTANAELKLQNSDYDAKFEAYTMLKKHLPGYMSAIICTKLQGIMNNIISSVFSSMSIQIMHSLRGCDILVKRQNEESLTSRMCSGLEKSMISIAFKLALIRMYGMNMFIGDEIDKFSDEENALKLFENIIDDSSLGQVFIVTHKPGIIDDYLATRGDVTVFNMLNGSLTTN